MASASAVLKRFKFDQEELRKSPVANVSAVPLENNMFEWHCNIRQDEIIFHLILFFPKEYPYKSPSAEFLPTGFQYNSGATKQGKKGTQVCLDIFSDFSHVHTEWKDQKGVGWSPAYTVQTILMNLVAFLAETQSSASSSHTYTHNLALSKSFTCADCSHSYVTPFPNLDPESIEDIKPQEKTKNKGKKTGAKTSPTVLPDEAGQYPQLIDYISKETFQIKKPSGVEDLWGYGLAVSGTNWRPTLTSPCEFITGRSFYEMKSASGTVQSVFKEELKLFIPLYIHHQHGSEIKKEFEKAMRKVGEIMPKYDAKTPVEDLVLKTIPNLLTATVVEFSKGTQHTSDNSLNGYFALHRLFLWAIDTYPKLQAKVEEQVSAYLKDEENRSKDKVPYIAEWLMLISGSNKYKWKDVAAAYLSESWKRNVIWYVKDDGQLGDLDTPMKYRIKRTYDLTEVARKHLAFQASFLNVAMPDGMSRKDIIKRYDDNFGFPTTEMVQVMKEAFTSINTNMKNYQDWFKILNLPVPSDDELYTIMVDAVRFSIVTKGYSWSGPTGGGWVNVLKKYKDMSKELASKSTDSNSTLKGAASSTTKTNTEKIGGEKKGKERSASRGKGKSVTKGRKRKAELDSSSEEEDVLFSCSETSAKGPEKSRGRGRGGAAKKKC